MQVDPLVYGIDDFGPLPEMQTNNHVVVPRSAIQLNDEQRIALSFSVNSLDEDDNYGIDIYMHVVQIIMDIVQPTDQ